MYMSLQVISVEVYQNTGDPAQVFMEVETKLQACNYYLIDYTLRCILCSY